MPPRTPITLAIGRFEDLISRGLRALIDEDPNVELVAHDVSPERVAATLRAHAPQVAILNFGSLRSPLEVHRLHSAHPDTRLVVLASRPTQAECNQMLTFGATACLSKETQARDVLSAIHLASRGLHVLPHTRSELAPENGYEPGPELLTAREADVLELLQHGCSNAQIAASLHVSVETVRTHARHVYRKLGVHSRRELAALTAAGR